MNKDLDRKLAAISPYMIKEGDTGSQEVQAVLLTDRINILAAHIKLHPKDFHSKRGLLGLVSKRRKLLNYLKSKNLKLYNEFTGKVKPLTETILNS